MITPSRSATSADCRSSAGQPVPTRRWRLTIDAAAPAPRRSAPRPQPRRLVAALDGLLTDGAPAVFCLPAEAAARAFAAGSFLLPGQIIDRVI